MLNVPPAQFRLGKVLVIFVFTIIFAAMAAVPLYLGNLKGTDYFELGPGRQLLAGTICTTVIFGVLAYCTWIGQGWARWFTGFLLFVVGILILSIFKDNKISLLIGVGVTLAMIGLGALLTLAPSIEGFVKVQAHRRRFGITDDPSDDVPDEPEM